MTHVRTRRSDAARRHHASVLVQFVKFVTVGISNTLLSLGVYAILVRGLGMWYLVASALAFAVGAINGYLLNRSWTFRHHDSNAVTAMRWALVQGVGLLLNLGLVFVFVDAAAMGKLEGQALAIVIVVLLTFIANRAWTFRVKHRGGEEHEVAPHVVAPHAGAR